MYIYDFNGREKIEIFHLTLVPRPKHFNLFIVEIEIVRCSTNLHLYTLNRQCIVVCGLTPQNGTHLVYRVAPYFLHIVHGCVMPFSSIRARVLNAARCYILLSICTIVEQ